MYVYPMKRSTYPAPESDSLNSHTLSIFYKKLYFEVSLDHTWAPGGYRGVSPPPKRIFYEPPLNVEIHPNPPSHQTPPPLKNHKKIEPKAQFLSLQSLQSVYVMETKDIVFWNNFSARYARFIMTSLAFVAHIVKE